MSAAGQMKMHLINKGLTWNEKRYYKSGKEQPGSRAEFYMPMAVV